MTQTRTWKTRVRNIIQIQLGSEELHVMPECWYVFTVNTDLGDMTFGQYHDTPLGHGQQLCEILSR